LGDIIVAFLRGGLIGVLQGGLYKGVLCIEDTTGFGTMGTKKRLEKIKDDD